MTDLGTLGGSNNWARDINDSGQVAGYSETANNAAGHAYITGPDGMGMTVLGTLGGSNSAAYGINDLGEVVGVADTIDQVHAFLFSHGGITDLALLDVVVAAGWRIYGAADINNNGQIIGSGFNSQGQQEAFLLAYTPDTLFDPKPIYIPPIPEPETYLMLLAGLGLVGFMALRRKKAGV
jgi:probable HAF family extracellular repeat protein